MKYTEVTFVIVPYSETASDIIAALTAPIGFDSFVPTSEGVMGYVPAEQYDEASLHDALSEFPLPDAKVTFEAKPLEDKDWNAEWEQNFFQPIVVDGRAVVHSTFHTDYPKADYDIVINPQMAFGTGHHQTTRLMMSYILDADLEGKEVLDMGCGTGILAILACMRGARHADAIDIDSWCADNTRDNIRLNPTPDGTPLPIDVACGDASLLDKAGTSTAPCEDVSLLKSQGSCSGGSSVNSLNDVVSQKFRAKAPYDVILANINRNILLADMPCYVASLRPGGHLFISGFYLSDLPLLRAKADSLGLHYLSHRTDADWTAAEFALLINK